jgi:signal transduction histidine kinase
VQSAEVMTASDARSSTDSYAEILSQYFTSRAEEALYRASLLSQRFIEEGLGPEEIVAVHADAVETATDGLSYRERARASTDALQFLLEVMIAYGVQYQTYLDLRLREREREADARLALERQRVADAERSEHEKEEILATISHELRTPLTAALGNIDLARRHVSRGNLDRLGHTLNSARGALGRLARLTDDLVEASRGSAPRVRLEPIDAGGIFRQACAWAQPQAEEKGVNLICTSADDLRAVGDGDALQAVFSNLLSNAIRYTPAGGRIEATSEATEHKVVFSVTDTGIGMGPEVRDHIFERFYRSPEAKRAEPRGLGLGLSIALRLVQAHGGSLEVDSRPGEGSTFRVRLPREPLTASEASEAVQEGTGD